MRELITLECGKCRKRNYSTRRNKKLHTDRLEIKKFCRSCRAHTPHKETK
ncbi:MAG: 50S ribosomal protein L33 [Candidatus Omnitrophica bacterium]|nr:50S ribosomal protein L33 [Candidatus Omnitrophota bacterium]